MTMRNPERFARYVAALREWHTEHRACCSNRDGWQALGAMLDAVERGQMTAAARRAVRLVSLFSPGSPQYCGPNARAVRRLRDALVA